MDPINGHWGCCFKHFLQRHLPLLQPGSFLEIPRLVVSPAATIATSLLLSVMAHPNTQLKNRKISSWTSPRITRGVMPAKTNCHCRLLVLNEFTHSQKTSQHPRPSAKTPSTPPHPICSVYAQNEFHWRPPGESYIVVTLWPVFLQGQPRKLTKISFIFLFQFRTPQTLKNEAGGSKNETQTLQNRGPEASKIEPRVLQDVIFKDI